MSRHNSFKRTDTNKAFKRICAMSDGTWKSAESEVPSNILRLTEAIDQEGDDGVQQVVFYDAGVGEDEEGMRRMVDGVLGRGVGENVMQLYTQIALNYDIGDEIYFFGFSRGAYTVRSVAGLIYAVGLLSRSQLHGVRAAYAAYRSGDAKRTAQFARDWNTLTRVPIEALVCFDTVGALGIPVKILGVRTPATFNRAHHFHDTTIGPDVRVALHALSIDEERAAYEPTRMRAHATRSRSQVTALFFWGQHSGVGGGKRSQQVCADITLRFMVDELERRGCRLRFIDQLLPPDFPTEERLRLSTDEIRERRSNPPRISTRNRVMRLVGGTQHRSIQSVSQLHWTAIRHFQYDPTYRPAALEHLGKDLGRVDWRALRDEEICGCRGKRRSTSRSSGGRKAK